jgi:hypothetical protein
MLRIIITLGLTAAAGGVGYFLPYTTAMHLFAIMLAMLTGSFFAFGLLDGRRDRTVLETAMAVIIGTLILFAMWKHLWLILTAYIVHAVWCVLHYPLNIGARVPKNYALLFLIFDLGIAGFMFVRFG